MPGNRCVSERTVLAGRQANELFAKGQEDFRAQAFDAARSDFLAARRSFEQAGDYSDAKLALKNAQVSTCRSDTENLRTNNTNVEDLPKWEAASADCVGLKETDWLQAEIEKLKDEKLQADEARLKVASAAKDFAGNDPTRNPFNPFAAGQDIAAAQRDFANNDPTKSNNNPFSTPDKAGPPARNANAATCTGGDAGYPVSISQPGNLNQRYGPSWSCNSISLVPQSSCQLFNSCLPCMNSNEDFYQDTPSSGHCVTRTTSQPASTPGRNTTRPTPITGAASAPAVDVPGPGGFDKPGLQLPGDTRPPKPLLPPGAVCDGLICAIAEEFPPAPPQPDGSCDLKEAKTNLDWVCTDAGARANYFRWRQYGLDPTRAAVQAQAHNRHAQQTMMNCFSSLVPSCDQNPPPPPLPTRSFTMKDCHCITIVPNGRSDDSGRPLYSVTNSCPDRFMMSITMLGSISASKPQLPSSSVQEFLAAPGQTISYSAPDRTILSIYGWTLRNASSKLQCFIPQ
jgi:hypothetical protein